MYTTRYFNLRWIFVMLMIVRSLTLSFNQPKFSVCATWNPNAVTFANNTTITIQPNGIFIDTNDSVYITDKTYNRVQIWTNGSSIPTRTISGGLNSPFSVFVTSIGDIYVDNGNNGRVNKWLWNTTNTSVTAMNITSRCLGLFVDINQTLYCSYDTQHKVVKKSLINGLNNVVIAAGNGTNGSLPNLVNGPTGIFVDTNLNLYVADTYNHRIQCFQVNQENGTTLAGASAPGTISLYNPTGIILDANQYLYIADQTNNRIVRSGPFGFYCIVACLGSSGNGSNKLYNPRSLSFDSAGNIYVTDKNNNRVQKFFLSSNSCAPSFNQPKFSSCATWNPNATTIANTSLVGNNPMDVFVDLNNYIYVPDSTNNSIRVWLQQNSNPKRISPVGSGSPRSIFVALNGDIYFDNNSTANYHIDRRTLNGTTNTVTMYAPVQCFGLFIDAEDYLYCSLCNSHQVIKKSLSDSSNISVVVAGTGNAGNTSDMLNLPRGIFVDSNLNLYVADLANNRIQLFQFGQSNGTTVSINGTNGTFTLNLPTKVVLDSDGYLFIADNSNQRILGSGPLGFRCIVGCTGTTGTASYQLNKPYSLSFDSYGSLFVIEYGNSRLQKFVLASNSCDIIFSTVTPILSTDMYQDNAPTSETSSTTSDRILSDDKLNLISTTNSIVSTTLTTSHSIESSSSNEIDSTTSSTITVKISDSISTVFYRNGTNSITSLLTQTTQASTVTSAYQNDTQASLIFLPMICSSKSQIGSNCNVSANLCNMLKPCRNNASCINNNSFALGYMCLCTSGFNGIQCQLNIRPCQSDTCWNNGTCIETSNTTFICQCPLGWKDKYCQTKVDYCQNVTCLNNGVCQPLLGNYTCQCLGDSYSGRHCEIVANAMIVHQIVSRSFTYVGITAILIVVTFIIILDVMKYFFGIDPVVHLPQQYRRRNKRKHATKKNKKKRPIPIIRFTYVDAPPIQPIVIIEQI